MTSARMYLAAVSFLELAALVKHKSTWASKVAPKEKQPAGFKARLKSPDNVKKLIIALEMAINERNEKNKKRFRKAATLSDDDDEI